MMTNYTACRCGCGDIWRAKQTGRPRVWFAKACYQRHRRGRSIAARQGQLPLPDSPGDAVKALLLPDESESDCAA